MIAYLKLIPIITSVFIECENPCVADNKMSKHSLEPDKKNFWKKMKYSATAAVAVGTGLYAVTAALKKPGLIASLVDEVKTAMHTTPLAQTEDAVPKLKNAVPKIPAPEDNEARAVLNMQMQFAMKRQDLRRVQEISRQLDLMDNETPRTNKSADAEEPMIALPNPAEKHISTGDESQSAPVGVPAPMKEIGTETSQDLLLAKTGSRKTTKQIVAAKCIVEPEISPRQAALAQLQVGDIVEALDPVTCTWSPAIIHTMAKSGLVEVRWDDPGHEADGKPFHPIGEVWAEQIRVKRRRPLPPPTPLAPPCLGRMAEEVEVATPPFGLQIGEACFAQGIVVEVKWFEAKLIGTRARSPPLRVEYVGTLDGQTNELLLPSPRKDYVNMHQIRREKPEESTELPRERRVAKCTEKIEETSEIAQQADAKEAKVPNDDEKGEQVDDVVITHDLMCSICERPDDEENMLVCDCKKGFHIYCLKPPLAKVPEGDWLCPKCAKKK